MSLLSCNGHTFSGVLLVCRGPWGVLSGSRKVLWALYRMTHPERRRRLLNAQGLQNNLYTKDTFCGGPPNFHWVRGSGDFAAKMQNVLVILQNWQKKQPDLSRSCIGDPLLVSAWVIVIQGLAGYDLLEESMVKMARRCSFFSRFQRFHRVFNRFDRFDCTNG